MWAKNSFNFLQSVSTIRSTQSRLLINTVNDTLPVIALVLQYKQRAIIFVIACLLIAPSTLRTIAHFYDWNGNLWKQLENISSIKKYYFDAIFGSLFFRKVS